MASEIAKNKTGSDVGVYFPFSQDKKSLRQAIKGKKFSRCGSDAITLLETFSPYKGGNWELRELHDLDIMDKHKSLIPDPKLDVNPAIDYEKWEYLPGSEFNYQFTFPEESLFKGRELVSGSKGLVDLCEDILDAFASI